MRLFLVLFALGFVQNALGESLRNEPCNEVFKVIGGFQYHQMPSRQDCLLSVHPLIVEDLRYRDYLFSSSGELMVFNSYGEGNDSTHTGARVYTFFPRHGGLSFQELESEVWVHMPNPNLEFGFSVKKAALVAAKGAEIFEDYNVTPENKGGLEVRIQTGIMLDSGFALGKDPRSNLTGTSKFVDPHGNQCEQKNSDLYDVVDEGDLVLKRSDEELKSYLLKVCPQLRLDLFFF